MTTSFGIEEEFVLLDRTTLTPADIGGVAVTELADEFPGAVTREFFTSQIEHASEVCTSAGEALDALTGFRSRLATWARSAGVVVAATGTPFRTLPDEGVSPGSRYRSIAYDIAGLTAEHQINGLHVHVRIPDREAGIRASNALRPWLPVLLALSANSPFWHGRDTGFDSWRTLHSRRWPTFGIPPWFHRSEEYDSTIASISGVGATSDSRTINWNVRLSDTHPTVEVRVCDAQLDPSDSVALAIIIRALAEDGMEAATEAPPRGDAAKWDVALWHSARYGVDNGLVHPPSGRLAPTGQVLDTLRAAIAPTLARADESLVSALIERVARDGNGATAQRKAFRAGGVPALRALYGESTSRAGAVECVGDAAPGQPFRSE